MKAQSILRSAGITVKKHQPIPHGQVYEIETPDCLGFQGIVHETRDEGVTVALRVPLEKDSPLYGLAVNSEQAHLLLGTLTAGLQGQGLQALLLARQDGLEGVLISKHLCESRVEAAIIKEKLSSLKHTAESISSALKTKGKELTAALYKASLLQVAQPSLVNYPVRPMIAPTFDLEARDRMMKEGR